MIQNEMQPAMPNSDDRTEMGFSKYEEVLLRFMCIFVKGGWPAEQAAAAAHNNATAYFAQVQQYTQDTANAAISKADNI